MSKWLPKHLEGFNLIAQLGLWLTGHDDRSYEVRTDGDSIRRMFFVRLRWTHNGLIYNIQKAAKTPEESAWLALEDFNAHEKGK